MKRILTVLTIAAMAFSMSSAVAGEGKARIITTAEDPVNCISPMEINSVDGKELAGTRMQIELDPGKHTITGLARINTSFCSRVGVSRGGRNSSLEPLEAEFEAGKTYYIGVNHKASRDSGWFYEIWKVEDSK